HVLADARKALAVAGALALGGRGRRTGAGDGHALRGELGAVGFQSLAILGPAELERLRGLGARDLTGERGVGLELVPGDGAGRVDVSRHVLGHVRARFLIPARLRPRLEQKRARRNGPARDRDQVAVDPLALAADRLAGRVELRDDGAPHALASVGLDDAA